MLERAERHFPHKISARIIPDCDSRSRAILEEAETKKLAVTLTPPEKTEPRQVLSIPVQVTGAEAGTKAYVTVAAVDLGILNLTNYLERRPGQLSGGQRQRVAIARVMLKDAPILILDEATSALDSEVETVIQQSLYRLMEGKTVVAIAHRLSTIAAMDRLVVMDRGRIVEEGDHRSLLALGGVYARLWEHQSGGFLGDEEDDESAEALERRSG